MKRAALALALVLVSTAGFALDTTKLNFGATTTGAAFAQQTTGQTVRISACDPLNLVGIITPGPRIPAVPGHHVTYKDGVPALEETRDRRRSTAARKRR